MQPGCFFGARGKSPTRMYKAGGRGRKAKTTVQPVSKDDSASEESVQVVSPPAVTCLIYDNEPNRVGSKPSNDKPLGRFILS